MTTTTVNEAIGFTLRGFAFDTLFNVGKVDRTSTMFKLTLSDGSVIELDGTGFKYDSLGEFTAGTLKELKFVYDGTPFADIKGISVAAKSVTAASHTLELYDDLDLIGAIYRGNDKITGNDGNDVLLGFAGNDTISGAAGTDKLSGGAGKDSLYGGDSADRLMGDGGADYLRGDAGDDSLYGGSDADRLYGSLGADLLNGGTGKDQFIYKSVKDSTSSAFDTISGFSHSGGDKVDLSAIDASTKASGNNAFSFKGEVAFTKKAGELILSHDGGHTFVDADVNGDGKADLHIQFEGNLNLVASDFFL